MASGWDVVQFLGAVKIAESDEKEDKIAAGYYIGQSGQRLVAETHGQVGNPRGWHRYRGEVRLGAPDTLNHWLESTAVAQTGDADAMVLEEYETGCGHRQVDLGQANGFVGNVGWESQTPAAWWSNECSMPELQYKRSAWRRCHGKR